MESNTQNKKIEAVTEKTLDVGIDVESIWRRFIIILNYS